MNEVWFKTISALALWMCIVIFGLIPIKMHNFRTNQTLLSLSNCFSGGLFIAIGLIHILPEAHNELEGKTTKMLKLKEGDEPFPLSYVLCLGIFSFILLIDKVFFNNNDLAEQGHQQTDLTKSVLGPSMLNPHANSVEENFKELTSSRYKLALRLSQIHHPSRVDEDDNYHRMTEEVDIDNKITQLSLPPINNRVEEDKRLSDVDKNSSTSSKFQNIFDTNQEKKETHLNPAPKQKDHEHKHDHDHKDHKNPEHKHDHEHNVKEHKHTEAPGHGHHHHHVAIDKNSYLSAYIILTAMGIHGIFAGLAFGVSKSETEIINMFIAMIAHKWSEALTVGISFVTADLPERTAILMIFFLSSFTPLGIFLGYLISVNDTISGICKALSAGTFIYISCAEIIVEEFSLAKHKFIKFAMYMLGILFVVAMGFLE